MTVILLTAVLAFNFWSRPKNQILQFAQVTKQDIKSIVSSSGTLTGKNVTDLKFKSSGRLAFININPGDQVFAYQAIAGLDSKLLEIDLQQARNTYRDKQAAAEKVEDDVKDHSKDETFTQKATRSTAQVARDNAYDEVKAGEKALQDAYLFTPIAGIVTRAPFVAGQNVSVSDVIVQVVDFSQVYFDTEIDESDIGKISLGQKAEVTLDAYPDKVSEGTVDQIIPQTETTSSGATVVKVRIKLTDPEIILINGLSGQAEILLSEAKDALTIPIEALGEGNMVTVQNEKGQQKVKVVPGIQSDTDVEIKEGLKEGDKIWSNFPG